MAFFGLLPVKLEKAEVRHRFFKPIEKLRRREGCQSFAVRPLIQKIQEQLTRLACAQGVSDGVFDGATVQGLRQASLLTDDRYLWYRPTMAALRALRKVDSSDGCAAHQLVAGPRCLRVNDEDFCR